MSLTVRKAEPKDVPLLRYWDEQPHVKASDPDEDWEWETELGIDRVWREQFITQWNGIDVGFLQLMNPSLDETRYWGDAPSNVRAIDIWIGEAENLNQGIGKHMMSWAIKRCFDENGVDCIWIDPLESNKGAIRFYQRLGFRFVENKTLSGDFCAIHHLSKADWIRNNGLTY